MNNFLNRKTLIASALAVGLLGAQLPLAVADDNHEHSHAATLADNSSGKAATSAQKAQSSDSDKTDHGAMDHSDMDHGSKHHEHGDEGDKADHAHDQ